jgi:hypothetical protein
MPLLNPSSLRVFLYLRVSSLLKPFASRDQDQDLSHQLDETPPNTLVAEGGPSSDEPSDGSNQQGSDPAKVTMQELQIQGYHATPESSLSGCVVQRHHKLLAYFESG